MAPSSDLDDMPSDVHCVTAWLEELENNMDWAIDGQRLSQYGAVLESRGFLRLPALAAMTENKLLSIFKDSGEFMNEGTAQFILKYAKRDYNKYKKDAMQKQKRQRLE